MPPPGPSPAASPSATIVLVTHEFHPHRGGIAVYAMEMGRAAVELGYTVEVWAPALPPGVAEPEWPFTVRRLNLKGDHSLLSQWQIARELVRQAPRLRDAILYISEPGPLLAMLLLQYFGTIRPARLMLTLYGSEIQRLGSRVLLRWSTNHLLARIDRVGVISDHARKLLHKHFPQAAPKVVVTPCALRTDLRSPTTVAKSSPRGKSIILTVARLNPRKGQLQIIEALKQLPPKHRQNIEYWLVGAHGKENYDLKLEAAAREAGFPVRFLGDLPDEKLSEIYSQADIFAMTSMPHKHSVEGFGMVYLEAGVHGLPVIAYDIGGVPDAVVRDVTGLMLPPGDIAGLTRAFVRLLDDPELRQRLGEAGRNHALAHTWRDSAAALFGQPPGRPST